VIQRLGLLLLLAVTSAPAEDTNPVSRPPEEIVEVQGIKIWKRGKPTNAFVPIGNESLMGMRGFPEAQNRIVLGVRARKGNAAIITSMIPTQRLDLSQITGSQQLDGVNVRYEIILLKP
jgi:hypothetical protein